MTATLGAVSDDDDDADDDDADDADDANDGAEGDGADSDTTVVTRDVGVAGSGADEGVEATSGAVLDGVLRCFNCASSLRPLALGLKGGLSAFNDAKGRAMAGFGGRERGD